MATGVDVRVDEKPQMLTRCDIKRLPKELFISQGLLLFIFSHDIFVLILFGSTMIYGKRRFQPVSRQILATEYI